MKKNLTKVLAVAMVCGCLAGGLSACSNSNTKETQVETTATVETQAETQAAGSAVLADQTEADTQTEYPQIVCIEGQTYTCTDEVCETVPKKAADGEITTFVEAEIMPDMDDSANFGSENESLQYMFLDDGKLIVQVGTDWYYFE